MRLLYRDESPKSALWSCQVAYYYAKAVRRHETLGFPSVDVLLIVESYCATSGSSAVLGVPELCRHVVNSQPNCAIQGSIALRRKRVNCSNLMSLKLRNHHKFSLTPSHQRQR
jgi:hypothetical protein